ncbi:MAG: sugar phosphate isomerase/epimerase family protein [Phycisphaerales bacterium]
MTSRREFLAVAGGAAAAVTLGRNAPAQTQPTREKPAPSGPRIRKALKYGMIDAGDTVRAKFEIAMEAGFEGVELDSPSDLDKNEVLRAKEATGIEIPGVVDSVHWQKTLGDADPAVRAEGRHALEKALFDCRDYGGTSVLLVPAVVNESISYAQAWANSQEQLQRSLAVAREAGVSIALENVWNNFLLGPVEAREYVDSLAGMNGQPIRYPVNDRDYVRFMPIGWHLDIGNLWFYAWPEHWIELLGPRILKLDVKGYSRAKADKEGKWAGFGVEIGDGDIPWERVNKALDKIGYRGWAAAEVKGGDLARLKDVSARMDRVFNL